MLDDASASALLQYIDRIIMIIIKKIMMIMKMMMMKIMMMVKIMMMIIVITKIILAMTLFYDDCVSPMIIRPTAIILLRTS